jgi:hypothetical protein
MRAYRQTEGPFCDLKPGEVLTFSYRLGGGVYLTVQRGDGEERRLEIRLIDVGDPPKLQAIMQVMNAASMIGYCLPVGTALKHFKTTSKVTGNDLDALHGKIVEGDWLSDLAEQVSQHWMLHFRVVEVAGDIKID